MNLRRALVGLLLMAVSSVSVDGWCQALPAPVTSLADSLSGDARRAYESGKMLIEDGDPRGALTKFQRAYELSKEPRLLWNMAVCEKELRHYANAARLVSRYLAEGGTKVSAASRQNAEQAQETLRGFYSELSVQGAPSGASVSVDGSSVGTVPLPGPIPIDLGKRRVVLQAEGFEPFERMVEVPGATEVSLTVSMIERKTGATLSISSAQAHDIISVDGKVLGSGHWSGELPAGTHRVRVTAKGKQTYDNELQLSPGASRTLQVALQDERSRMPVWPWIAGGAALLVGAGIGGYFVLKSGNEEQAPRGALGSVYLPFTAPRR